MVSRELAALAAALLLDELAELFFLRLFSMTGPLPSVPEVSVVSVPLGILARENDLSSASSS